MPGALTCSQPPHTAQGAVQDLDQALSLDRFSAAALRCRGCAKLMLGDIEVSSQPAPCTWC